MVASEFDMYTIAFTLNPPPMKLTYFGHSTFQIETGGTTLLFDPFFIDNPHTNTSPEDVEADVVLLTHAHFDHFANVPEVLENNPNALVISNFEITQYVGKKFDHENIQPLNEGADVDFDWGTVSAVHARHTSSFSDGTYGGTPGGFVLELDENLCVYNTGDTAPFVEMEWIGDMYEVDLMLAPIGNVFTMGIDGALMSAEMVQPGQFAPLHYDTFPPLEVDLDEFNDVFTEAGFSPVVIDFDGTLEM